MGYFGHLINAGVRAVGGGLKGQNEGDDEHYRRRRQKKADELEEQALLLRRYAAERQERHYDRQERHYDWSDQPEWKRKGYGSFEEWDQDNEPRDLAERNIDPLSPEGMKAREGLERRLSKLPRRPSADNDDNDSAKDTRKNLTSVERQVDDTRADLARAEREVPPEWGSISLDRRVGVDSASYESGRRTDLDRVEGLRQRADSLGGVRDSIAGELMHGKKKPDVSSGPPPIGRPPDVAADHPELVPREPRPDIASPTGSAASNPELVPGAGMEVLALAEIERQYQAALTWRGPNGEKKDPAALEQRRLEAIAQVQGGGQ